MEEAKKIILFEPDLSTERQKFESHKSSIGISLFGSDESKEKEINRLLAKVKKQEEEKCELLDKIQQIKQEKITMQQEMDKEKQKMQQEMDLVKKDNESLRSILAKHHTIIAEKPDTNDRTILSAVLYNPNFRP